MSDHALVPVSMQPVSRPDGAECATLVRLATLGAVVGGTVAAASSLHRIESGELPATEALAETGKTAVAAAVATAIGGAAAAAVAEQGLMRLGILFVAGTLALYGLQRLGDSGRSADE